MFKFDSDISARQLTPGFEEGGNLEQAKRRVDEMIKILGTVIDHTEIVNKELTASAEETGQEFEPLPTAKLEEFGNDLGRHAINAERAKSFVILSAFQALFEKKPDAIVTSYKDYKQKLHVLLDTVNNAAQEASQIVERDIKEYEGVDVKITSLEELREELLNWISSMNSLGGDIEGSLGEFDDFLGDLTNDDKDYAPEATFDDLGVVECPCGERRDDGRFIQLTSDLQIIATLPLDARVNLDTMPKTLRDELGEPIAVPYDPSAGVMCTSCFRVFSAEFVNDAYVDVESQRPLNNGKMRYPHDNKKYQDDGVAQRYVDSTFYLQDASYYGYVRRQNFSNEEDQWMRDNLIAA